MKAQFTNFLHSLPVAPETPCAYFPERKSRVKAFTTQDRLPSQFYEHLLSQGYRRCGSYYYQQQCSGCRLCLSYRLKLGEFQISTSQKKVLRKNRQVTIVDRVPHPDAVKEFIYLRYQYDQHFKKPSFEGENEDFNPARYLAVMYEQMYTFLPSTREIEIWDGKTLMAFGILDTDGKSVSAVYTVYDPDYAKRSPGTLFLLKAIEWAKQRNYEYLHLGFFIPNHPKMEYKSNFKPGEVLNPEVDEWQPFEEFMASFDKKNFVA